MENKLPRSSRTIEILRVSIATSKRDSRKGAFIASAESLYYFINPVGIENSSHSRQKLPLFPDSRDDSCEWTYLGSRPIGCCGSNNAIHFFSFSISLSLCQSLVRFLVRKASFPFIPRRSSLYWVRDIVYLINEQISRLNQ